MFWTKKKARPAIEKGMDPIQTMTFEEYLMLGSPMGGDWLTVRVRPDDLLKDYSEFWLVRVNSARVEEGTLAVHIWYTLDTRL